MLVDSHCHLNCLLNKSDQLDDYIQRAQENNISHLLCVCIDLDGISEIINIIDNYSNIHGSIGIHPNSEPEQVEKFDEIANYVDAHKIIAIGETGLDYYRT
ncbi:MAG: TatD family hydrolase, partial [Legionellales bacterium]|nr:TatD family hydrolase [Legionellales bacterium]